MLCRQGGLLARNVQRLVTLVRLRVALCAQRDQILFRLVAGRL
jgi:hypothetical protein